MNSSVNSKGTKVRTCEELQAYLIRRATLLKHMKQVKVEVPTLLSGWHLLTRPGVPLWTQPNVWPLKRTYVIDFNNGVR